MRGVGEKQNSLAFDSSFVDTPPTLSTADSWLIESIFFRFVYHNLIVLRRCLFMKLQLSICRKGSDRK